MGLKFWGTFFLAVAAVRSVVAVDVWVAGESGYASYRIPAVVRTGRGTLVAFCVGRRG